MYRTSDKALTAAATILWQGQEPPMRHLTVGHLLRQGAELNEAVSILAMGDVQWVNGVLISDLIAVALELVDTAIEDRMANSHPVGFKATWENYNSIEVLPDMFD